MTFWGPLNQFVTVSNCFLRPVYHRDSEDCRFEACNGPEFPEDLKIALAHSALAETTPRSMLV